jgi:hypothetical protein
VRIFLPLPVDLPDEPDVRGLAQYGRDARALRDLYVQMLSHCKRTLSDGFVPAHQIGILVYPDSPKNGERDVRRLADAGLCVEREGGWYVPAFLAMGNKTRAEVEQETRAAADDGSYGGHKRWHVNRDITDPACRFCAAASSAKDGEGYRPPYGEGQSGDLVGGECTETEPQPESQPEATQAPSREPDRFAEFWSLYPKKVNKGAAQRAWKSATNKNDPGQIIDGLSRLLPSLLTDDPQFVPHPSSWLNGTRWEDEPPTAVTVTPQGRRPAFVNPKPPAGMDIHSDEYQDYLRECIDKWRNGEPYGDQPGWKRASGGIEGW